MATQRVWLTETAEWKAREVLGKAKEKKSHLESMVVFWTNKVAEVQAKLDETKSFLAGCDREIAVAQERVERAIELDQHQKTQRAEELKAKMAELQAKLEQLQNDEL